MTTCSAASGTAMPEPAADYHTEKPTSIRLGDLRPWAEAYAKRHGIALARLIKDAVREKRDREEGAS